MSPDKKKWLLLAVSLSKRLRQHFTIHCLNSTRTTHAQHILHLSPGLTLVIINWLDHKLIQQKALLYPTHPFLQVLRQKNLQLSFISANQSTLEGVEMNCLHWDESWDEVLTQWKEIWTLFGSIVSSIVTTFPPPQLGLGEGSWRDAQTWREKSTKRFHFYTTDRFDTFQLEQAMNSLW